MSSLCLLISILNADFEREYTRFYKEHGVETVLISLCSGTASKKTLDYLGLEKNEKVMVQTMLPPARAREMMDMMVTRLGLNLPGTGIAMMVPVGSIAGSASIRYLTAGQQLTASEAEKMKDIKYALITAIADSGFSEMVMDAAREQGARGGTIVHAKGTGSEFMAKFFGVSIAQEKEMIYIVAKKSDKDAIMRAIVEKAGPKTQAKAVVFSLPVTDVAGMTGLEN